MGTEGATRKIEFNGNELMTVNYTPGSHTVSQTVNLPTGEHLIMSVSWPRLQVEATDLGFILEVSPDRKFRIESNVGWDCANNQGKNVYLDSVVSSPYMFAAVEIINYDILSEVV